jgi:hypothetical protein
MPPLTSISLTERPTLLSSFFPLPPPPTDLMDFDLSAEFRVDWAPWNSKCGSSARCFIGAILKCCYLFIHSLGIGPTPLATMLTGQLSTYQWQRFCCNRSKSKMAAYNRKLISDLYHARTRPRLWVLSLHTEFYGNRLRFADTGGAPDKTDITLRQNCCHLYVESSPVSLVANRVGPIPTFHRTYF